MKMIAACIASLFVAACDYPTVEHLLVGESQLRISKQMIPVSCPPEEYHTDHFIWLRDYMELPDDSPAHAHLDRMAELCLQSYSADTVDDKAERYRLMMLSRGMPPHEAELRSIEYKLRVQSQ